VLDDFVNVKYRGDVVVDVEPIDCDVLVMQRPLHSWMAQAIPHYQRRGVAVVVENDDDFHALDPDNLAYARTHPRANPKHNWQHLMRACGLADLVTVTTPALARRYGAHGRVRVVPNFVEDWLLELGHCGDGQTVGWGGVIEYHPGDLRVTRGGVAAALEEAAGARFLVIGTGDRIEVELGMRREAEVTGPLSLEDYHRALSRLDIGIVPLADTRFTEAKSALKFLQYFAVGVAGVASPRPEYRKLAEQGMGLLAKDRFRDWYRQVKALLGDEALRSEVAQRGRELVKERHLLSANAWRFAEAWGDALASFRRRRAAAA
jgi:glycosyltransferase involved in cell wall biosynthesis